MAQPGPSPEPADADGPKSVTLSQTVRASYVIEPIVHRFRARRGETIPFSFEISSTGSDLDIEVIPVKLQQNENGVILHDEKGAAPDAITLSTPSTFRIPAGETKQIAGKLSTPLAKTNFLSYGILVRDAGKKTDFKDDGSAGSRAGVRFVTQYVLRIDLEVTGASVAELGKIKFVEGGIDSVNGFPVVRGYVENPTDYAFEFRVGGSLSADKSSGKDSFQMYLPSRADVIGPDRYVVRLLPKSRVRVLADYNEPLFPGETTLTMSASNGRRSVVNEDFVLNIEAADFPATATKVAMLGEALTVSPAQLELGQTAGRTRIITLSLANRSDERRKVSLVPQTLTGEPLASLKVSPSNFTLLPGRTKTIRAILSTSSGDSDAHWGKLQVVAADTDGETLEKSLPIAMILGDSPAPNVQMSEIAIHSDEQGQRFSLSLQNNGEGYLPIDCRLAVIDTQGRTQVLAGGFGKWLGKGEREDLVFPVKHNLLPGDYQLRLDVQTHSDRPPMSKTFNITLNPKPTE